jgi:hypothetical protein
MASLALISTGRRDPTVPAVLLAGAALSCGVLAPVLSTPAVARATAGIVGCIAFLVAFVLWAEAVDRPFG